MDLEKIKKWAQENQLIAYPLIAVIILIVVSIIFTSSQDKKLQSNSGLQETEEDLGLTAAGVGEKSDIARLKKDYFDLEDRLKELEKDSKSTKALTKELKKDQKEDFKELKQLIQEISIKMGERISSLQEGVSVKESSLIFNEEMQLAIADIKPIEEKDKVDTVYLPLGSFCKGTLLTGVYAAADQSNPLPVLISLDEAFYGPNQTRIPLKGAFVLGKAYGDLVSERALIQIIAISSVLPDGVTFENEQNLGYVTDGYGELGIRGQVIRNTGRQLATSFMSGFLGGGAQAMADQEVTVRQEEDGDTSRQVTGNGIKNAVFQGLATSAGKMSDYYAKQTENLVPAIHVKNGQSVYFIVQKGVSIDGLSRISLVSNHISE